MVSANSTLKVMSLLVAIVLVLAPILSSDLVTVNSSPISPKNYDTVKLGDTTYYTLNNNGNCINDTPAPSSISSSVSTPTSISSSSYRYNQDYKTPTISSNDLRISNTSLTKLSSISNQQVITPKPMNTTPSSNLYSLTTSSVSNYSSSKLGSLNKVQKISDTGVYKTVSSSVMATYYNYNQECNFDRTGDIYLDLGSQSDLRSSIYSLYLAKYTTEGRGEDVTVSYLLPDSSQANSEGYVVASQSSSSYQIIYPTNYSGAKIVRISFTGDGRHTPVIYYELKGLPSKYNISNDSLTLTNSVNAEPGQRVTYSFENTRVSSNLTAKQLVDGLGSIFTNLSIRFVDKSNGTNCNDSEYIFDCVVNSDAELSKDIMLEVPSLGISSKILSLNLNVSVSNTNHDLNPTVFSTQTINKDINQNSSFTIDLGNYITDQDGELGSYHLDISNPNALSCSLNQNSLTCNLGETSATDDSLIVTLTDTVHNATSNLLINVHIVHEVINDLHPTIFKQSSASVDIPEQSSLSVDLRNYIEDLDGELSTTRIDVLAPSYISYTIEDYNLTITPQRTSLNEGVVKLSLTDTALNETSEMELTVNILPPLVVDEYPTIFNTTSETFNVNKDQTSTTDLTSYLSDQDGQLGSYRLSLVNSPSSCSLDNTNLVCSLESSQDFIILVHDNTHDVDTNMHVFYNVIIPNESPTISLGSSVNKSFILGEDLSYRLNLNSIVTDLDTPFNELTVSLESVSGDLGYTYTVNGSNLDITLSGSHSSYKDLVLVVNDGHSEVRSESFRLSLIDPADLHIVQTSGNNLTVASSSVYDMSYDLHNDTGFAIDNLDVGVVSSSEDVTVLGSNLHIQHLDNGSSATYSYDINITKDYADSTSLQDFVLSPKVGSYTYLENVVNLVAVPLNKEMLSSYFDIQFQVPGSRDDGLNTNVPMGVKMEIPYTITSTLDRDVNLYLYRVMPGMDVHPHSTNLYTKQGANYVKLPVNYYHTYESIHPGTNNYQMYVSTDVYPQGAGGFFEPTVFLDLNTGYDSLPNAGSGYRVPYYSSISSTFIGSNLIELNAVWENSSNPAFKLNLVRYTVNGQDVSLGPVTLQRDMSNVPVVSGMKNNYQFKLVDLNFCNKVYYRPGSSLDISLFADDIFPNNVPPFYIGVDGTSRGQCRTIDLSPNEEKALNFTIRTGNNVFDGSTGRLGVGYVKTGVQDVDFISAINITSIKIQ